ncbi:MAG: hypothetical protein IT454_00435 [Planctomycetes bacterium]|nr:hypothetical protein [Planctomycetota bacterium]
MSDPARPPSTPESERRAALGLVLIGLGVLGILWGVFHILEAVPKPEKLEFAHRTTDFQARSAVHDSFLGGLLRALVGLGLALWGGRLRSKSRE